MNARTPPPLRPSSTERDDEGGGGDDGDGQTQRQLSEDKCWLASSEPRACSDHYVYIYIVLG